MASRTPAVYSVEEGQHYVLESRNDLPLQHLDHLGHGGSASVEKVQDTSNGTIYARKIYNFGGSRAERHRAFENEVQIIKRLTPHHHVIRVVATYIAKREVGVILSPVASQGSLNDLLQEAEDGELSFNNKMLLWESFGCLSSGLYFMHTQHVRHKDIKPHNILIHNYSFVYTDFGCSLDHSASTRSITTGLPSSVTQRYAGPEIMEQQPRRSKTDIFSLGCVFLEILAALHNISLGEDLRPYRAHLGDVYRLLGTFKVGGWGRGIPGIMESMLNYNCDSRPSAFEISSHLWNESEYAFCDKCKASLPSMNSTTFRPYELWGLPPGDQTSRPISLEPSQDLDMIQHETSNPPVSAYAVSQSQDSQAHQGYSINPQFTNSFHDPHRPVPGASLSIDENNSVDRTANQPSPFPHNYKLSNQNTTLLYQSPSTFGGFPSFHNASPAFTTHDNTVSQETEQNTRPSTQNATASSSRTDMSNRKNRKELRCEECGEVMSTGSQYMKHSLRHSKPFVCDVPGCKREGKGFASANDLERHKKSVHRRNVSLNGYRCASENCTNRDKRWLLFDNFKQHIERMHPDEDYNDLIGRSVCTQDTPFRPAS